MIRVKLTSLTTAEDSHPPGKDFIQYNDKLLRQIFVRAVGDSLAMRLSEKYLF